MGNVLILMILQQFGSDPRLSKQGKRRTKMNKALTADDRSHRCDDKINIRDSL